MAFEDFAKEFIKAYDEVMNERDSADYEPNPEQWKKLMDIIEFFYNYAEMSGAGKVEPVKLVPKEVVGYVTAKFILLHVFDDEVLRLCEVLKHASAISIDATTDGYAVISVTVPDVFRKKSK